MSELLLDLKSISYDSIVSFTGDGMWNSLDTLTQTGVLTAELCLRTFSESPEDVDFSASVMPLMKALENELTKNFYIPYTSFLKNNYSDPYRYVRINGLTSLVQYPEEARRKIIGYDKKRRIYWYKNPGDKKTTIFTIGDYRFTAGVDDLSLIKCDKTAVAFYKQTFFGNSAENSKVTAWICKLTQELEGLRRLRNDSAHAGKTQTMQNAVDALDVIIRVNKVLMMVSSPSLE